MTVGGISTPTEEPLLFSSFTGSVDFPSIERIDLLIQGEYR